MNFVKDDSNWPLVVYTINGDVNSSVKDKFDQFLVSWTDMYVKSSETKQKFRLFLDVTHLGTVQPAFIMAIIQFLKKVKELTEMWMEKTVIFLEGGVIKTILDTVFVIYKPVRPFKVFTDKRQALVWALNNESGDETRY